MPVQYRGLGHVRSGAGGSPIEDEVMETPTQKATRRQRERRAAAKEATANGEPKIDGEALAAMRNALDGIVVPCTAATRNARTQGQGVPAERHAELINWEATTMNMLAADRVVSAIEGTTTVIKEQTRSIESNHEVLVLISRRLAEVAEALRVSFFGTHIISCC